MLLEACLNAQTSFDIFCAACISFSALFSELDHYRHRIGRYTDNSVFVCDDEVSRIDGDFGEVAPCGFGVDRYRNLDCRRSSEGVLTL